MTDMFSLKNRVALVTGASRGLGFAMAKALAANGATVVINARNAAELEQAAGRIGAEAMAFDVTDAKAARAALEEIVKRHGKLDILVNNAGIQHRRAITDWEDEDFDRVIAVNLSSCFRLSRDAVRLMLPNKFGRIINTGSVSAILGRPTIHAYVAAKAGLHGLTRSMAAELGRQGITVNALAPGFFPSRMTRGTLQSLGADKLAAGAPLRRIGDDDDLKGAALLFASAAGKHITGQILPVDGGVSAVHGGG